MEILRLAVRVLLAGVFAVAGGSKLIDRPAARESFAAFGIPAIVIAPLAAALPIVELAIAWLLLTSRGVWWGGVGAVGLLLMFTVVIAVNLAQGRTPACHCFGQLHPTPIGWATLARNGILAVAAVVLVSQGSGTVDPSVYEGLADSFRSLPMNALSIVLFAAIAIETFLIFELFRQNGRLMLRMDQLEQRLAGSRGLAVGAPAPPFTASAGERAPATLASLQASGRGTVVVFSAAKCPACVALLPDIARWQRDHAAIVNVVVVDDAETVKAYDVPGTPAAVLVRPDGTIGSATALGRTAITSLIATATGASPAL